MILLGVKKKVMDEFTREFAANNNETTLRYWTVPLLHQNLRGATLSSKDIPISPYTKGENNNSNNNKHIGESNNNNHIGENNNNNHIGENNNNNNNNIVSSLVQYSSWIINLCFKVIQVLFLFC